MKKIYFSLFLIFPFLIVFPQDTINVPGDYTTIQAGINAANNGDLVLVEGGTYIENINYRGKAITVASNFIIDGDTNHISNTIIDGSQPSHPDSGSVVTFNSGEDTTSVLCGFTITGGNGTFTTGQNNRRGGGVLCYQSGARIEYNFIENNEIVGQHSLGGGISGSNYSSDPHLMYVIIENNKIRNNRCESTEQHVSSGGVHLRGEGRIISNQIINNEAERTGVPGNNQNSFGAGILCGWNEASFAYVKIYDNLIADNRAISNNGYANGGGVDIQFTICDFRGNTVKDNKVSGTPYANGGGMRVYFSSIQSNISDNNFINNGPLNVSDIVIGGGLLTAQTDGLTVENNVFQFNSGLYGGGMRLVEDVNISVLNNSFLLNEANYGGGMDIYADSVISVRNNRFVQNNATNYGGGLAFEDCSPLIENNLFAGNTAWGGGGIAVSSSSENSYNKSLVDLQIMLSGGLSEISDDNILQSPLKKNTTVVAEPLIINNTIVNNTATAQGGGIYNEISQPTVLNTILWGNIAAQDSQLYSINGTFLLEYSDIQGWDTTNNTIIDVDPFFVSGDTLYHLQETSPCIQTAIDTIEIAGVMYFCPPDDIEGNPRPYPVGTMPDMGAYEYQFLVGIEDNLSSLVPVTYSLLQNYPNPFNPSTTIEFALPTPGFVTLSIFNILGEKVATPVSEYLTAGSYKYHWDAKRLTSGVYLYKLEAGNNILVRKMILIR